MTAQTDELHKFLFESGTGSRASVRGEVVCLTAAWRAIAERHEYPAPVLTMLGELVAASTLLSANLKFNGSLVMQIHGDGPVRLLVVECSADLVVRAMAKIDDKEPVPLDATFQSLVNRSGRGRFALTLDPKERHTGQEPYQAVVPLEGHCVAEALENYMLRSEQLDTQLWLAADPVRASGLLLQKLPSAGGKGRATDDRPPLTEEDEAEIAAETWSRAVTLAQTLGKEELLAVEPALLIRRLFWEETLRVFDPMPCAFHCTCSRARVAAMLVTLGEKEVHDTLSSEGVVQVRCEFCNRGYAFDAVDCAQLFATDNTADGVRAAEARHH